jgi:hypothetical protein
MGSSKGGGGWRGIRKIREGRGCEELEDEKVDKQKGRLIKKEKAKR